jgi:type IV pilus assembly protein PilB
LFWRNDRQPLDGAKTPAAPVSPPPPALRPEPSRPATTIIDVDAVPGTQGPSGGRRLGDILVERALVTPAQLSAALVQQPVAGKRLGTLLVELGALTERALVEVLAEQKGLDWIDLRRVQPQPPAVALVPEAVARACTAIPIRVVNGELEVAVPDPFDPVLSQVKEAVKNPVRFLFAPPSDIARAIEQAYRALAGMDRHVDAFTASAALRKAATTAAQSTLPGEAPVVQAVDLIITQALRDRASDIHIEPQDARLRVRYRIDGVLRDELALPESMGTAVVSRIKIMAQMNIVDRRRAQDGQIAMEVDGRWVDIRVATTPTIWGEKAVLRLLDRNRTIFQLDDLGMPADIHEQYSKLVRSPIGMMVCAGPTGSGKTTTLYATLSEINEVERNVTTIEDPVEYVFPSINQIQINEQAGITFAGGLRSILRQDPDVILVGEIRDPETAQIAVQSALTGHAVLSSLHATDASSALHRFLDMGIETFLIASSVIGVVSQRLVRRICAQCRVPYQPTIEEMAIYEALGGPPKTDFTHGEGCFFCSQTGYQSRIGVYELMAVTDAVKKVLIDKGTLEELRAAAVAGGMRTLHQEGTRLVASDVSTIAEISRSIYTLAG